MTGCALLCQALQLPSNEAPSLIPVPRLPQSSRVLPETDDSLRGFNRFVNAPLYGAQHATDMAGLEVATAVDAAVTPPVDSIQGALLAAASAAADNVKSMLQPVGDAIAPATDGVPVLRRPRGMHACCCAVLAASVLLPSLRLSVCSLFYSRSCLGRGCRRQDGALLWFDRHA